MSEDVKVYVGAENIFAPLGATAQENFNACLEGETGIKAHEGLSLRGGPVWVSKGVSSSEYQVSRQTSTPQLVPRNLTSNFKLQTSNSFKGQGENKATSNQQPATSSSNFILEMLYASIADSLRRVNFSREDTRIALILSTTKGNVQALEEGNIENARLGKLLEDLEQFFDFGVRSMLVSNACISGSLALILAHDMIAHNEADHVIVTGADVVSRFTVTGFESLYALSKEPCRPFCKTRNGISLGEGAATVILSRDKKIFNEEPFLFLGGATSNDANHISGPSRTGEGLFRAISKTLSRTHVTAPDIDFISAHGTGTWFNDDMESIAFHRAGLQEIPVNSFKGYFGHTLGAAGVIEAAMCLQSFRNGVLLKNEGMKEPGTVQPINILKENLKKPVKTILKTASGFGGCNAAFILKNEIK